MLARVCNFRVFISKQTFQVPLQYKHVVYENMPENNKIFVEGCRDTNVKHSSIPTLFHK